MKWPLANIRRPHAGEVKIYSHPRSGTHLLEAFLGLNFFPDENLALQDLEWGHWSNRLPLTQGNPLGKLFGSHRLYSSRNTIQSRRAIYIVRDVRAVAYSVWKTPNFRRQEQSDLTFLEFLRSPIDWRGSPGSREPKPHLSIIDHWAEHVQSWTEAQKRDKRILIVRYEDLLAAPANCAYQIAKFLFPKWRRPHLETIKLPEQPVGLLPNAARINSWEKELSAEEFSPFIASLPEELSTYLAETPP